jgi:hypothetical protein
LSEMVLRRLQSPVHDGLILKAGRSGEVAVVR